MKIKSFANILVRIITKISRIQWEIIYWSYVKKYNISDQFRFNGERILFYGEGIISCGKGSRIGRDSGIQVIPKTRVAIGNYCQISHYVHIYTMNNIADMDLAVDKRIKAGDVIIGDYCWIGMKVSIMGPLVIGDNVVIGANSLVTRDIPPDAIVIGVPAQVVKFKSYVSVLRQKELAKQYRNVISDKLMKKLFE